MKKKSSDREACLGIFWLVNGKLIIDSSPLTEAEPYGNHLGHPRSHIEVWEKYQRGGEVPLEMEYEQAPRGRVVFDRTSDTFTILADKCILRRKDLIASIKSELNLPKSARLSSDYHYRCFTCLYGTDDEE
ncbi:MAG: hypothetical protein WAN12_10920 [Candidatus Acidiferrum sp.]